MTDKEREKEMERQMAVLRAEREARKIQLLHERLLKESEWLFRPTFKNVIQELFPELSRYGIGVLLLAIGLIAFGFFTMII